jgi:hypothetical protein
LTVGLALDVIKNLFDPVQAEMGLAFCHIPEPCLDRESIEGLDSNFLLLRDEFAAEITPANTDELSALEQEGVPTIHNMIMGDRVLRSLKYSEALAYASFLARRLEEIFLQIRPSIVISGFDNLHCAMALAVARKIGIPWFGMHFSTIPAGMTGFCTGITPDTVFSCRPLPPDVVRSLAERTLSDFEGKQLVVPAYLSANNLGMVIKRFPKHVQVFSRAVARAFTGRFDKYTQYPVRRLMSEYLRKRLNLFTLPKKWLLEVPPALPYVFIGLHMQPESSIDVWAPFFANQFAVIESIARAIPPNHQLLVKLHKSDADNYSRRQLDVLRRFPGVELVSPWASSRTFIEKASLVVAIQGHIAMEAALLGRPVLLFGDVKFSVMPSVTKVNRVTDLPRQIRNKLSESAPGRDAIVEGLMSYISCFAPGCYNDWESTPSPAEIEALADHFRALLDLVEGKQDRQASGTASLGRVGAHT